MTVSADGAHVYVIDATGNVTVIDVATNTVIDTITVGGNLIGPALNLDGSRAYVTGITTFPNGTVTVIGL